MTSAVCGPPQSAPAASSSASTAATSPGTSAGSPTPGCRWSAVAAAPPPGAPAADVAQTAAALQARGIGLFTVQPPPSARTHCDALDMALLLQARAGVEAVATLTTWDKTIMMRQADLLGAHALGLRNVIAATAAEIARARAKVAAGAQFLVSRPVYELDSLLRVVTTLDAELAAADLLRDARKLVGGVILTAAKDDLTVLAPLLAVLG